MNSEKVKEIKELLLRKAKEYESQTLLDILTLINELESENERLKEHPIMKTYSLHNACERIPKAIDETLKEYENDTI